VVERIDRDHGWYGSIIGSWQLVYVVVLRSAGLLDGVMVVGGEEDVLDKQCRALFVRDSVLWSHSD
jgi:hypothetical protein